MRRPRRAGPAPCGAGAVPVLKAETGSHPGISGVISVSSAPQLIRRARRSGVRVLRDCSDAGEHRSGIAVQDLLARFLTDLRFRECLPGPVAAELGAVGAAHDAVVAVQALAPFAPAQGRPTSL